MTTDKPKEFWIDEGENGFDLGWYKRWVAQFPEKDSIENPRVVHVIEHSAYQALKEENERLREEIERVRSRYTLKQKEEY